MNRVLIMGWLGSNPILNHTKTGTPVCNFSVATNKKWRDKTTNETKEKTTWHRVTVWGNNANNCMEYLNKGSQVLIEGELESRSWEDNNGNKRWITEINAGDVSFIGKSNNEVNEAPNFAVEAIPF